MLVSIITPSFPSERPGIFPGIERVSEGLARGFAKVGCQVIMITILRGNDLSRETWNDCEIIRLRNTNWYAGRLGSLFSLDLLSFGCNVLRNAHLLSEVDLAISNMQFPFFAELSRRVRVRKTAVMLYHKHPYLPLSRLLTAPFADAFVKISQPDLIIVPSKFSAAMFGNLLHLDRSAFSVVPLGVDHSGVDTSGEAESSRTTADKRRTLLYVGTADKRKHMDLLLESFVQVLRRYQDARLVIVGPGHQKTKRLAAGLGLEDRVEFPGIVTDTELARHYEAADIFVSASTNEGFGLVLGEAMAHGLPVAAFRAASLPEVVCSGGILVDPYDIAALSKAICHLFEDAASYRQVSSNAVQRARALTWENSARDILGLVGERGSNS